MNQKRILEIMDTTLRDGEQTSGVGFSAVEKFTIAKLLLEELKVDRIEVASARVSEGELAAVQKITHWASGKDILEKIEVLTFVDKGASLEWMQKAGAKIQNLLAKGSLNHLKYQLKKNPEEHFQDIAKILEQAKNKDIFTNIYLEDWSNGMKNSKNYVLDFLDFLKTQNIQRVLLPDTLGILTPSETFDFIKTLKEQYPDFHFDFHAHNDYDLSVANVLESIKAGVNGVHLTVNGLGERAGNAPLASVIAVINDHLKNVKTSISEKSLNKISRLVENFSSFMIPPNKPVVGANVFTQTAGVHADGDAKKNLYYNDLTPERFDRKREYALGKTSGKANIKKNLEDLGLELTEQELKKVTQRVIELGDKKQLVTQEDLPYIISDVLDKNSFKKKEVEIQNYLLTHAKGLQPATTVRIVAKNKIYETQAQGDGQFDAFMNAIKKIYETHSKKQLPKLVNYLVTIPQGSRSDSLCKTLITWQQDEKNFITCGLDADQTVSSIQATEKMLNKIGF